MKKVAKFLKTFEKKVSQHIDSRMKVAYALVKLCNSLRSKEAISERDINRAVEQHFRSEGLEDPPKVNWGELFSRPVYKLSNKFQWSEKHEEDILSSVFQDLLMGQNLDTGGTFSGGNLADWVRTMKQEGKGERDIKKLVQRRVRQKAINKSKRRAEGPDSVDVHQYDPTQRGEEDPEEDKQLALDILDLDPVSQGKANDFLSMMERDPEMKEFMEKVDQIVQRKAGDKVKMLWKKIKESPDFGSRKDLYRDEVTIQDPDTGKMKTMPMWKAFGKSKPNDVYYEWQKLQDILEDLKPMAKEYL